MERTEIIGLIAGTCTSAALVPQVLTTIKKKQAQDVSVWMFMILLVGNTLWVYYGLAKSELPIIATNLFSWALDVVLIILKIKYKDVNF
jgi:MtN3 and saliva related transmembrane protein